MLLNAVEDRVRIALHHEAMLGAHSPQRDGRSREAIIDPWFTTDPSARADVMQREVAEGMNDLVAQRRRYSERSPVYYRSRWRGDELGSMAHCTANGTEQRLSDGDIEVNGSTARSPTSSHKISEGGYVFPILVFGVRYRIKRSR